MEHEFTVGSVLSNSFKLFFKNFGFMFLVGFLAALPLMGVTLESENFILTFGGFILYIFAIFLMQGIVVYAVYQGLSGQTVNFSESLAVALKRILPLLGVTFLTGFIVMFGYVLLIIPGIIFTLMLWVAVPICIVEKGGVGDALRRSKFLTDGYKGTIFFIVVVTGLIGGIFSGLQSGFGLLLVTSGITESDPMIAQTVMALGSTAFTGISSAFSAVVVTVGYYSLRHEVEGVAVEDLATVFE